MNHSIIAILAIVFAFCNEEVYGFNTFSNRLINRNNRVSMSLDDNTFLVSVIETSKKVPDDYVYGQVNAPPFVLPLAAVAIIAFAAIPFLLTSGEKALGNYYYYYLTKLSLLNSYSYQIYYQINKE